MADDLTKRGAADRARINIQEEHEVRYWAEKFGVTPVRLKDAVAAVGPIATKVEAQLKK